MATINGNTVYFSNADEGTTLITGNNIMVLGVTVGNSSGNGTVIFGDDISGASYPSKTIYEVAANNTMYHDYSNSPLIFPKGIRLKTCSANTGGTIIFRRSNG